MVYLLDFGETREYNTKRLQYSLAMRFLKKIQNIEDKKILDMGCGMGEFINILHKKGIECVVGVEGSQNSCDYVSKKGFVCRRVNLEEGTLPFKDEEFDVIISLEVIEHLWNTKKYLGEISRVMKKDGYVLFTTPNYNHYRYRIDHLFGKFERFMYKSRHKKFYTSHSLKKELANYFRIVAIEGLCTIPVLRQNFFGKKFLNLFAIHIGMLCRK